MTEPLRAAACYCFAGLFTRGVIDGGAQVEAALEDGTFGVETALSNFPQVPTFTVRDQWPIAQLREAKLDLLYGNPACAGYSMANSKRGLDSPKNIDLDRANQLGWQVRPRAFMVESVGQLFTDGVPQVERWEKMWRHLGYRTCRLLESGDHLGLPQRRERAVFVAARANLSFEYPAPDDWPVPTRPVTLEEAIGDLAGQPIGMASRYVGTPTNSFQAWARRDSGPGLTWHVDGKLSASLQALLPHLPQGVRMRHLPDEVYEQTYWRMVRANPNRDPSLPRGKPSFLYRRLRWDEMCSVITGAARYVHPDEDRLLTVREYARLMGLPDTFRLTSMSQAYAELGKAVSPLVGMWLTRELARQLADPVGRRHQDIQDIRGPRPKTRSRKLAAA